MIIFTSKFSDAKMFVSVKSPRQDVSPNPALINSVGIKASVSPDNGMQFFQGPQLKIPIRQQTSLTGLKCLWKIRWKEVNEPGSYSAIFFFNILKEVWQ